MRSWLFVPGDSEKKLAKSRTSDADVLLIDLEDSVALDNKKDARSITSEFLKGSSGKAPSQSIWVRVNSFDSGLLEDDLTEVMAAKPCGILLPKAESGKDVTHLGVRLRVHEAINAIDEGKTRIAAIITETATATLNTGTYKDCSNRLTALAWGAEDLSADIGALEKRNVDGSYRDVFRYARTMTLLGAVSAGAVPIDTVYTDFRNLDGLRRECEEAVSDGFIGKMAIHPAQVPVINEVFTPSNAAVARARVIVSAFEKAGNPGVIGLDGEMLDRPHLRRAETLLAQIRSLGSTQTTISRAT